MSETQTIITEEREEYRIKEDLPFDKSFGFVEGAIIKRVRNAPGYPWIYYTKNHPCITASIAALFDYSDERFFDRIIPKFKVGDWVRNISNTVGQVAAVNLKSELNQSVSYAVTIRYKQHIWIEEEIRSATPYWYISDHGTVMMGAREDDDCQWRIFMKNTFDTEEQALENLDELTQLFTHEQDYFVKEHNDVHISDVDLKAIVQHVIGTTNTKEESNV